MQYNTDEIGFKVSLTKLEVEPNGRDIEGIITMDNVHIIIVFDYLNRYPNHQLNREKALTCLTQYVGHCAVIENIYMRALKEDQTKPETSRLDFLLFNSYCMDELYKEDESILLLLRNLILTLM